MSLPAWPGSLPTRPQFDGFTCQPARAPLATEFEDGPARMRRRSTAFWSRMTVKFWMTQLEFDNFENFWAATLSEGASRFTMPVVPQQFAGNLVTRTVYLEGGAYRAEPLGLIWQVSFTLLVLDW